MPKRATDLLAKFYLLAKNHKNLKIEKLALTYSSTNLSYSYNLRNMKMMNFCTDVCPRACVRDRETVCLRACETGRQRACVRASVRASVRAWMSVRMRAWERACVRACVRASVRASLDVCAYACERVCECVRMQRRPPVLDFS